MLLDDESTGFARSTPNESACTMSGQQDAAPMIYFIGGASGSGKSMVASKLAVRYGWHHIELDDIRNSIGTYVHDKDLADQLISSEASLFAALLLRLNTNCILEGGWIGPDMAKQLVDRFGGRFCPTYCGYGGSDVELQARYAKIRKHSRHWLAEHARSFALDWMRRQALDSDIVRSQCAGYGFPFFDFSDFEAGSSRLEAHFLDRLQEKEAAGYAAPLVCQAQASHGSRLSANRFRIRKRVLATAAGAASLAVITASSFATSFTGHRMAAVGDWLGHAVENFNHLFHPQIAPLPERTNRSRPS